VQKPATRMGWRSNWGRAGSRLEVEFTPTLSTNPRRHSQPWSPSAAPSQSISCSASRSSARSSSRCRRPSPGGKRSASHWVRINSARSASPCSSSQSAKTRRRASSSGVSEIAGRKASRVLMVTMAQGRGSGCPVLPTDADRTRPSRGTVSRLGRRPCCARRSYRPHQPASANRLRQHGHSPSHPLRSAENAVGCGSVMSALKASGPGARSGGR
jgi:hypothetical protein